MKYLFVFLVLYFTIKIVSVLISIFAQYLYSADRSKAKKQKSEAASSITEPEVVNQEVKKVVRQTSDTSDEFDGNYYSPHLLVLHKHSSSQTHLVYSFTYLCIV